MDRIAACAREYCLSLHFCCMLNRFETTLQSPFSHAEYKNIMIFDKFIKPKWQHRNPETRLQAVEQLQDLSVLSQIAQNDEVASIRRLAIAKLDDLTLLESIAQRDPDNEARELAHERFKAVLCGLKNGSAPLMQRIHWLNQSHDPQLIEHVLHHGQEFEMRLAALGRIHDENLLGDIAMNDPTGKVRQAAVEKIADIDILENVLKTVRNRDKGLTRILRDKLDLLIAQRDRPLKVRADAEEICARFEKLGQVPEKLDAEKREVETLTANWQAIAEEAAAEFHSRFHAAQQAFQSAFTAYQQARAAQVAREQQLAPLRAAKQAVCEQLDDLLQAIQTQPEIEAELDSRLQALREAWAATAVIDEAAEEQSWQKRFALNAQALVNRQQALLATQRASEELGKLCQQAERLLKGKELVKSQRVQELQARWETRLAANQAKLTENSELPSKFTQLIKALEQRLQRQIAEREQALIRFKRVLDELEAALEKGEFHTATQLEQEAQSLFPLLAEIPATRHKTLDSRLQVCVAKVRDLRSWQRWGENHERESLCDEVEALIERPDDNPEETARLIHEAQIAWKKLNPVCPQELWERFNTACNRAYLPCKVYFEEQARTREENLQKKVVLCEQLESYVAQIDWQQANWKMIQQQLRNFDQKWHAIGHTNRKSRKQITDRFEAALKTLQTHLDQEQQVNQALRRSLMEQAQAAVESGDVNAAIENVKHLQTLWLVTVPGSRRDERKLWQNFRGACDQVFEKRKEQQAARKQEQQAYLNVRNALCADIEALTQLQGDEVQTLPAQLKKLQADWRELGQDVSKKALESVEKHFHQVCQKAERHYQAYLLTQQREQFAQFKAKAQACFELESLAAGDNFNSLQTHWEALPALSDVEAEQALQQRFHSTLSALQTGENPPYSETALKERELLCIRMEVLAGVASPSEAAAARMEYQVSRLNDAIKKGEAILNKNVEAQQVERAWYFAGAVSPEQAQNLEARFQQALGAFYQ